jgi:uncharacterized membrane protein
MPAEEATSARDRPRASRRILALFMIGFIIVILGVIILIIATAVSGNGSTGYGIIIFIGPIPIVLGSNPEAIWLILFAIILTALNIVVFLLMRRRSGEKNV